MGWLSKVFNNASGGLISQIKDAADEFHLSGEEKQKFKLRMNEAILRHELSLEESIRKNIEAKERIIVAELNQDDKFTKRARPSVVYFGLFMIFINYCIAPLLGTAELPLPVEFWVAWGGIVSTWTLGRSFEKGGKKNKITEKITGKKSLFLEDDDAVG